MIKIDGSGRVTLRNRKFWRKYEPLLKEKNIYRTGVVFPTQVDAARLPVTDIARKTRNNAEDAGDANNGDENRPIAANQPANAPADEFQVNGGPRRSKRARKVPERLIESDWADCIANGNFQ